ncbi:MAG: hypothetical protein ABEJ28_03295 [Salinigranum sp.]
MDERTPEGDATAGATTATAADATDATADASEPDERSLRWAWFVGLALPVVTLVGVVGALQSTPGDPFACRIPNPGAWMLCRWTREFVFNAVTIAAVVSACAVILGLLIGVPRAVFRAVRRE